MNTIKFFLLALCIAFPFSNAFATDTDRRDIDPVRIKRDGGKIETQVLSYRPNEYVVVFGNSYNDVEIEVFDEDGYLLGSVAADYVTEDDVLVVRTRRDGAVELIVFSGDEEVFSTEL